MTAPVTRPAGWLNSLDPRARTIRSRDGGVPAAAVNAALGDGWWQCEQALPTLSDSATIMVRARDGSRGVLKVAASGPGAASLRQEHDVLTALHAEDRLGGWRDLLPVPLHAGVAAGGAFLISSRLPGRDGRRLPAAAGPGLTAAAAAAIAPLHQAAATATTVTPALLGSWLAEPAAQLRQAAPGPAVDQLVARIQVLLAGRRVLLGWTHGDFFPGNLLLGGDGRVSGIVDWGGARRGDLLAADLAFWLLTVPAPGRRRALGGQVAARLRRPEWWAPGERELLAPLVDGDDAAARAMLLLAWLRHVAANLAKSARYRSSPVWLHRTITPVLRQAARG